MPLASGRQAPSKTSARLHATPMRTSSPRAPAWGRLVGRSGSRGASHELVLRQPDNRYALLRCETSGILHSSTVSSPAIEPVRPPERLSGMASVEPRIHPRTRGFSDRVHQRIRTPSGSIRSRYAAGPHLPSMYEARSGDKEGVSVMRGISHSTRLGVAMKCPRLAKLGTGPGADRRRLAIGRRQVRGAARRDGCRAWDGRGCCPQRLGATRAGIWRR